MSTKLTGYVWDACASSGMKLSSVAIMARLADFSSDEGVSWPSIATIARQIGAGESTVRTAISQLEKDGWLTRQQRRKGNRNASNVYQLNVTKLQAAAFSHLSESDASKSDASKSDPSKFDASKNSNNGSFHPSESGGDPSVKSTTDPSDKKPNCQVASQPDTACVSQVDLITGQAVLILNHLNDVTGKTFRKGKAPWIIFAPDFVRTSHSMSCCWLLITSTSSGKTRNTTNTCSLQLCSGQRSSKDICRTRCAGIAKADLSVRTGTLSANKIH